MGGIILFAHCIQKWVYITLIFFNLKYIFIIYYWYKIDGFAQLRAFLLQEFSSHENLDFWVAVEIYKKSRPQEMLFEAQKIYDNFVVVQAPNEVI